MHVDALLHSLNDLLNLSQPLRGLCMIEFNAQIDEHDGKPPEF